MSDTNQRQYIRTKLRADVKLSHPEVGDLKLRTADISDGGAYILSEGNPLPRIGEIVHVQVLGMGGDDAPLVKMKIVRNDSSGIGLEFVSDD
ncbi:MAG: PilZ domain-containing protein [Oceanicoccus sp.]